MPTDVLQIYPKLEIPFGSNFREMFAWFAAIRLTEAKGLGKGSATVDEGSDDWVTISFSPYQNREDLYTCRVLFSGHAITIAYLYPEGALEKETHPDTLIMSLLENTQDTWYFAIKDISNNLIAQFAVKH